MQLRNQNGKKEVIEIKTGTIWSDVRSLFGIHNVIDLKDYENIRTGTITSASISSDNVLTLVYSGTLPTGVYVVDTWGYNIEDLSGNVIEQDLKTQTFTITDTTTTDEATTDEI
jgi:hypothetical protein